MALNKNIRYTEEFIKNCTQMIAYNHKEWNKYTTYTPGKGDAKEWWYKGEDKIMPLDEYCPAMNTSQAFDLLLSFDLLGTNKKTFLEVLNIDKDELDTLRPGIPNITDAHVSMRLAILAACRQIILDNNFSRRSSTPVLQSSLLH